MPIVDISHLPEIERLPGWRGRFFHSEHMTVAHYDFTRGSSIHEHNHPQEEIYHVLEGELEMTIEGETYVARPGLAAVVPANARHYVRALTDGHVLIVDSPRRPDAAGAR
ncbi:MAG TPA: cupin domain-containing protein [Terracidiphilus sp.]|nr:cupin domain-containing protein [Terracidiphilus sp.]